VSEKKSGFLSSLFGGRGASSVAPSAPAEDFADLSEAAPPAVADSAAPAADAVAENTADAPEAVGSDAPETEEAAADAPEVAEPVAEEPTEPAAPTMRDKTVALISGKGGVGRTTTVLSLAGAAAKRGKRVLIVDFDPQGSLTLAALDGTPRYTIDELFQRTELEQVITRVEWDAFADLVDIAPVSRDLVEYDNSDHPHQYELAFTRRFDALPEYDLVLVEAPPSLASLATIAVAIAGTTVVVAEPKLYSIRGAIEAVEFAEAVAAEREVSTNVRVLINKVTDSTEAKFRHKEIRDTFGKKVLQTNILQADIIEDANGAGVAVHAMPGTAARETAAQFNALLDELLA
jgi:cellulose biosynthesis protein BcsQ